MNYLHQPKNDHERRTSYNAAVTQGRLPGHVPPFIEFVAPDDDKDLQVKFPIGKYHGLTLGQILEQDPGYLKWMLAECDLLEGPFSAAIHAVAERYQDRIAQAQPLKRRRF